jgi:2-iminoacetate synthase
MEANFCEKADFINDEEILGLLERGKNTDKAEIDRILDKAAKAHGLEPMEVAALLQNTSPEIEEKLFSTAHKIKEDIYGKRIVMFAPLYVSNYCVNKCEYCGYNCASGMRRKQLTDDEIRQEVAEIENLGHKRIALEAGEDDKNCPIDYITMQWRLFMLPRLKTAVSEESM